MTILDLQGFKKEGRKISMVTAYDYWSAKIIDSSPIDIILVGDSGGMVMHGFNTTVPVTMEMMELFVAAVQRGAPQKLIVGDLPFLAYRKGLTENVNAVQTLMRAGAHAVKLEGLQGNEELIHHLVQSGVPVMGHLGLTPQSVHQMGGFKVQGRSEAARAQILKDALRMQELGAFSLVLECVPQDLATEITERLTIPTIGIGAGRNCDGQVLVLHDLLGFNTDFKPKFVKRFLNGAELINKALEEYHGQVIEGRFPSETESFS